MLLLFSRHPNDADWDLLSSLAKLLSFLLWSEVHLLWEYPFLFCLIVKIDFSLSNTDSII